MIAGLLKAPSKYSPATSPGAARARGRVVLDKMLDAGFITQEDENRALEQPLVFSDQKVPKTAADAGYVVDYVLDQLPPIIGAGHDELIVETTLDKDLQRRAQEIVSENLTKKGGALGASQGALVVLDGDGGIRALVGGRDYGESQFNRAVKARRQPGSAFKPFVYLAALEHGMTPDSVAIDQPITIGGWAPKNDNGQYLGEITLRRALAQSVNTVAVRLNQDVGRGRTIEVAQRLGIKSELREGPSLALGTSEVTLLEMAGAYVAFSNGGSAIEPHVISRVRISSGRVLFASAAPRTDQVVEPSRIGALNDMMNAAVVYGTGRRAALAEQPVAGKTGHDAGFPRCLVHRLHEPPDGRRLDRQRQWQADEPRRRRWSAGRDLEPGHARRTRGQGAAGVARHRYGRARYGSGGCGARSARSRVGRTARTTRRAGSRGASVACGTRRARSAPAATQQTVSVNPPAGAPPPLASHPTSERIGEDFIAQALSRHARWHRSCNRHRCSRGRRQTARISPVRNWW